jgi:1-acyl-sn-glycerol-3-phosphate acyltransferase
VLGTVRMWVALGAVAATTIVLVPLQYFGLWTGWIRPGRLPRLFHKVATRALGFRIRVEGQMAAERPLLIVSNHLSWSDITIMGSVAEMSFVAKSDMASWPIFGMFATLQRSVFVERERRRTSAEQAKELADRLAAREPMVLFAEGTTGDGNFLLPFKTTLFGAARNAIAAGGAERVVVQPVAITYTRLHGIALDRRDRARVSWIGDTDLIPHLAGILRQGGLDVTVRFGEPVEYREGSDRKAVARLMERQVRSLVIGDLRGG